MLGPYPPPYAGPELAIKSLLESPLRNEVELKHLSTNVRKDNASKGKVGFGLVSAFFVILYRLSRTLISCRPQVVYFFVTATRMGWLGRDVWCIAISRLFGAKVITHMRAGHFKNNLRSASRLEIAVIRWACHRVSWSLVQTESLRNQFTDLAPEHRIGVVHNMIDVHKYHSVDPSDHDKNCVLFLGHLSEAKGYCDVLKVIPQVVQEFPEVRFQFAGTKIESERNVRHCQATGKELPGQSPSVCFDEVIAGKYEKNYEYLGVLDEAGKMDALWRCNFLVLPSYSEGFSMAVLEALAVGKPVVTTKVGAMQDVLVSGVHGEVIVPGDLEALADAIRKLLRDRDYRNKVAAENALYCRQMFSQEVIASNLNRYICAAINGSESVG